MTHQLVDVRRIERGVPTNNSYKITPSDHRSVVWLYGFSCTTSGAIYSGVPALQFQRVLTTTTIRRNTITIAATKVVKSIHPPFIEVRATVLADIYRAKPKSHSFTTPPSPIRMFCGFISRWIMRLECRYCRARTS